MGSSLLQQGYLQHVTQEHSFSDSELFFKVRCFPGGRCVAAACVDTAADCLAPLVQVMPLRNCPGDLTSLVGAMKDPSLGLFQDRQYRLRTYKCCAVGAWACAPVPALPRPLTRTLAPPYPSL